MSGYQIGGWWLVLAALFIVSCAAADALTRHRNNKRGDR